MQKKVLALAVAGLLSGAAFAQTTAVTFGGSIAMDLAYSSSHQYDALADGTYKSKFSVDNDNWQSTRLWWRAEEDLGNGLGVMAYQELRMRPDYRTGGMANQRSYLQLAGKSWGAIKGAGGFGNVLDDVLGLSEAKGADWGKGYVNPLIMGEGSTNDTLYNTVQYITPNFSGFTGKLSASGNDKDEDELAGNGKLNTRSYGLNGIYVNGPIKAGLGYLSKSKDGMTLKEVIVGGMYDFGMFQLGAAYAQSKSDKLTLWTFTNRAAGTAASSTEWKKKGLRLVAGVDITPMDHVSLSFTQARVKFADGSANEKVSAISTSFTHMLSKRTTFIAEYANVDLNEDRAVLKNTYENQFRVGLRHDF